MMVKKTRRQATLSTTAVVLMQPAMDDNYAAMSLGRSGGAGL